MRENHTNSMLDSQDGSTTWCGFIFRFQRDEDSVTCTVGKAKHIDNQTYSRSRCIRIVILFVLVWGFLISEIEIKTINDVFIENGQVTRQKVIVPTTTSSTTDETEYATSQSRSGLLKRNMYVSSPQPEILPLLDWEIQSTGAIRSCNSPKGIPTTCCLGSSSGGGEVNYLPEICNKSLSVYNQVSDYTKQYLQKYTVPHRMVQNDKKRALVNKIQKLQRLFANIFRKKLEKSHRDYSNGLPEQKCDICRIVDYLLLYNWTLAFQGDSVMSQTFQGMECELHRRGYHVKKIEENYKNPDLTPDQVRWRYGIKRITKLIITNPTAVDKNTTTAGATFPLPTATIIYYSMYRPIEDNKEIQQVIVQNSDILVFDHGLHWVPNESKEFEVAMTQLVEAYKDHPKTDTTDSDSPTDRHKLRMVAWRQTSAQHYNLTGGHYEHNQEFIVKAGCHPMNPVNDTEGYRLSIMRDVANHSDITFINALQPDFGTLPRQGTNELIFLPYREYTIALHYLHPGECTHFCHDPHVWLPIWRSLRIGMDRTVRLYENER